MIGVLLAISAIFLGSSGIVIAKLYSQVRGRQELLSKNLMLLRDQIKLQSETLTEVADLNLGLCKLEDVEAVKSQLGAAAETLRTEQGRMTITHAELDAMETRLRELEEIERELEVSQIEAGREVEMLKAQERDVRSRNDALRVQLESSMLQLDNLLAQLQDSTEAHEKLTKLKAELIDTQEKTTWYTEEVAKLNDKYMHLKKAYDAIDIEYAQLYEKHNALEAQQKAS